MKSILNHKMHSTTKVAILTFILLISIASPILMLSASAAATITLTPTSGPNGTPVTVSGAGFGVSEGSGSFTIAINGLLTKNGTETLNTNSTGGISGSFVIGGFGSLNLAPGVYSVQISDPSAAPQAAIFTITAPTVTLTPSTGPAGTSVMISVLTGPSGFTNGSNQVTLAAFAGTTIYKPVLTAASSISATNNTNPTTGMTFTLTYSSITLTNTSNTVVGTITPSMAWPTPTTGNTIDYLTGTINSTNTPFAVAITGTTGTATGTFIGSVPASDIGTTTAETVNVTITVAKYSSTTSISQLSSNIITTGSYTGTVSLPAMTAGSLPTFTLTDNFGNVATATYALNTPTVTLSPASGPVGTAVTATLTGFGPGATIASVKIGNAAPLDTLTPLVPPSPAVTEQGSSAFMFSITPVADVNFAAGAQMITVTDNLGDVATATFTIMPTVTITLGVGATNSGVSYAPSGTANVVSFLSVNGFKPNTALTITGSPSVPAGWTTFTASGYPTVTTDPSGSVLASSMVVSGTGTAPASGIYSVTVSDGTNTVVSLLTITTTGTSFFVLSPNTGVQGTTVSVIGFGASSSAINFDGIAQTATQCTGNAWPAPPTPAGSFTVPLSSVGTHSVTATGITGSATFTNTGAPTISVVSPTTAAVGTTVTIIGSGFAKSATLVGFSIDGLTVPTTSVAFSTTGAVVATFAVPAFLPTLHLISITDSGSNTATAAFTSTVSSISISPASGIVSWKVGLPLSITGSGFPMNQAVSVTLTSATVNSTITTGVTKTNTNGGILIYTTNIVASQFTTNGAHTLTVSAGNAAATATFNVVANISLATSLTPSGTGALPGLVTAARAPTVVPISGAGFAASSALTISLAGVATTWFPVNTTSITSDTSGSIPAGNAVIIPATTATGSLTITVADASGNSATVTMTVLGTPSITLSTSQAPAAAATAISVKGSGFTPFFSATTGALSARTGTITIWQGTTQVATTTTISSATVTSSGALPTSSFPPFAGTTSFAVPNVAAGAYTVNLTLSASGSLPMESAVATLTIMGAPTVSVSPTLGVAGTNVTVTVTGLDNPIVAATLGGAFATLTLNTTTVPTTGASAYTMTASFLAPSIPSGTYTLLIGDGTRQATTLFTMGTNLTLSPTTNIVKGSTVTIAGTGFGALGTAFNVTVNGVLMTTSAGTTGSGGTVSASFVVPLTANPTGNTVTVMDTLGNNATATFAIVAPTIALTPTNGTVGSTVQIIGTGFSANSPMIIQFGGILVTTAPASVVASSTGAFIAYVTVPAGLSGNQPITATDNNNNVGTANYAVTSGGATGFAVNTAALSSSAQTLNSAGAPATSFARGSSVKLSFVLDTTTGSGPVVWRITLQQGTAVYNIATTTASISTTPNTLSYTQLIPTGIAPGTWTASIQIFASDGVTPLGVATLTFSVT